MKKGILILVFLVLFSPSLAGESRIVTIDLGSFSGFFGFGMEWITGLTGHKLGLGVIDSQSARIGYAYKRYFPHPDGEEIRPSRIFFGPLFSTTFEDLYSQTFIRYRGGLQMGYDFFWGENRQYYANLAGGFLISYPPTTYQYPFSPYSNNDFTYYEAFSPAFTISFGYHY